MGYDFQRMINSWSGRIKRVGMSNREFAMRIGIHYNSLMNWHHGKGQPSLVNFAKVEETLQTFESEAGIKEE